VAQAKPAWDSGLDHITEPDTSELGLQLPTGSKRVQNVVEKKAWFFP
jgi:hypothetical protein